MTSDEEVQARYLDEHEAPKKIHPPWDVVTVNHLNAFQWSGAAHPFTCGNDSSHVLTATTAGWRCPIDCCDYAQRWALATQADPTTWHPTVQLRVVTDEDDNEETMG